MDNVTLGMYREVSNKPVPVTEAGLHNVRQTEKQSFFVILPMQMPQNAFSYFF